MATSFTLFPLLPTEIRLLIWEFCIPRRVVEVETPTDGALDFRCVNTWTTRQNSKPPVITRICKESRFVALKAGRALRIGSGVFDETFLQARRKVWFSPKHDVVAWYRRTDDDSRTLLNGSPNDPIRYFLRHTGRFQGAPQDVLFRSHDIFEWQAREDSGEVASFPEERHFPKRSLFICCGMAAIHTTVSQAFESGLWGITGEEIVQLIDPLDTERFQKFYREANPADGEAQGFFECFHTLGTDALRECIEKIVNGMKTRWVLRRWNSAVQSGLLDVPDPDQVWLGPRMDEQGRLIDMSSWLSWPHADRLPLNTNHPWVKSILDHMPTLRPAFMFRLCLLDCHTLQLRPGQWGRNWLDERERSKQDQRHNSEEDRRIFERR